MPRDAAAPVFEHFRLTMLGRLAEADLPRLIELHRRTPFGPHPDELARILNFFRASGTEGKQVIVRLPREDGWHLARVTGQRDEGSVAVEDTLYASVEEAEHAAFLARLREAGLLDSQRASR